jgi:hypothetical protein
VWNDALYRVMGTKLVRIDPTGAVTELGDVGGTGPCTLDYGFDRLAIRSGTSLYYWDGVALSQVTDVYLGPVLDMLWADGYYVTTDGVSIIVTELLDATKVDPLKYGSAEADPDMVTGLLKFREEIYALGRHTVQVFQNAGTTGFPFQVQRGATIPYGCVSASAKCIFAESFAFVGSARGEALRVYVAGQGTAIAISDKAIDEALASEADTGGIVLEARTYGGERRLLMHLPSGVSYCYFFEASRKGGRPVWIEVSGRVRNAVEWRGKFWCGDRDSAAIGTLDETEAAQFGAAVDWQFDTAFFYNKANRGIVTQVTLSGLPGRAAFGDQTVAFLSFTADGETYSNEKRVLMAKRGARMQNPVWYPRRLMNDYLGMRFRGVGLSVAGFASLEVEAEALAS